MHKARYYKVDGKKGRARALPDSLFDGVVNESVMHQVVKVYLGNQRQGTASAKTRSEVAGGAAKPWRQKGTGRARQGTIRAAQWTGGGMAFPPQPHSWRQKLPRKVRALAHRSAFNVRAEEERVILIDRLEMEAPKTATLRDYLAGIEAGTKVLVLTHGKNEELYLSSRNLQNVLVREFGAESVYDLLWAADVVIEKDALDALDAPAEKKAEKKASAAKAEEPKAEKPKAKKKAAPKAEEPVAEAAADAPEAAAEEAPAAEDAPEAEDDKEATDA